MSLDIDSYAWSLFRKLLSQGASIQQDYAAGRYESYEQFSARLDQAAREHVEALRFKLNL